MSMSGSTAMTILMSRMAPSGQLELRIDLAAHAHEVALLLETLERGAQTHRHLPARVGWRLAIANAAIVGWGPGLVKLRAIGASCPSERPRMIGTRRTRERAARSTFGIAR